MLLEGHKVQIKQCMPVNEQIEVEQLTEDDVRETLDPGSTAVEQTSRFYPGKVSYSRAARFKQRRYQGSELFLKNTGTVQL